MKQSWERLAERIDGMTLRERLLIFLAAAFALVMTVTQLVLDPLTARRKALLEALQTHQTRLDAARVQAQALAQSLSADPDAPLRARVQALRANLAQTDDRLAGLQQGLVSADRMADLLRELLTRHPGVRLVALKSLPAQGVAADGKVVSGAEARQPAIVYRHGIELTVEGRYADLLAYTEAIEASSWRLLWGGAKLTVQTYPVSRLVLTLYTLSPEKPWLSV
ncbi:hypothetical protein [Thiobacter aerophilum]|uniref:MSHA biogenesis protein MshJ n=1 Tax=Thiobacter aerophilum TaxID=3121275 RepID=A0ABV0EF74_9BURK